MTKDQSRILTWRLGLLGLPLLFYAAGLNPYFQPHTYDNVDYYHGAISIAEEGVYHQRLAKWPPVFPGVLAFLFVIFGPSMWLAKGLVLVCTGGSLLLAFRLCQIEDRSPALLIALLFALLPTGFLMGTAIMSEWPYLFLTLLFLNLLHGLKKQRGRVQYVLVLGVLLGIIALTRWVGCLLGAALLAQLYTKSKSKGGRLTPKDLLPELGAGAIGGAMVLGWILVSPNGTQEVPFSALFSAQRTNVGQAPTWPDSAHAVVETLTPVPTVARPANQSTNVFEHSYSFKLLNRLIPISDLFFQSNRVMIASGLAQSRLSLVVVILPVFVVLVGMVHRFRKKIFLPSDYYVIAVLVFHTCLGWADTRYRLTVAPFLIGYLIDGTALILRYGQRCLDRLRPGSVRISSVRISSVLCSLWILYLLGMVSYVLLKGNNYIYNGKNYWASPTADSYYKGLWSDLYRASQSVKNSPVPGTVSVLGKPGPKYVAVFSGREAVVFPPLKEVAFVLVIRPAVLDAVEKKKRALVKIAEFESMDLFAVGAPEETNP
jgi:hypothetical protein